MHLSHRAIETPRLVLLGAALVCALGVMAIFTLPKERTPRVKLPVIVVAVPNPGADPEQNERVITRDLEDALAQGLDGLQDDGGIISQSVGGAVVVQLVFDDGVDVDKAKQDVTNIVNQAKAEFPEKARQDPGPQVNDIAFDDFPIIQVVVAGGQGGEQRRRIAEDLEKGIAQMPGVAGVDIFGGLEEEVQVEVNPHLLAEYGLRYEDLFNAVNRSIFNVPTGEIDTATGGSFRIRSLELASVEEIARVPIGTFDGKPVILGDVAQVALGHKKPTSIARYGGEDAVVVLARAKTDIDVLATANRIQAYVDAFQPSDPTVTIGTVRSQAREIGYMLDQLGGSAVYGMIVIIVLLWIFMGWRNAALISIAIPFAILATGAVMWFTKRTITPDLAINNMTLFGMILVVGMVVDGCIIVGENIYRHREMGASPVDAAKRGITEVGPSLLGAYTTTFAAFAPMFLVRGIMGDFLELLPIVVLYALCAAMLVDHFILPVLSVYVMKTPPHARDKPAEREGLTVQEVEIRDIEVNIARSRPARVYGRMIGYAMHHRLVVLFMAVVVTLTPVALYAMGAIGVEFFPESDYAIVEVHFELPLGSSMEGKTVEVGRRIEETVMRAVRPEEWYQATPQSQRVKPVTTIGEPGALNIRLDTQRGTGPEYGMVYVELALAGDRSRTLREIRRAIVDALPPMPDVVVEVASPEEGPPVGAPVIIRVMGQEATALDRLAERAEVIEKLLRSVPGTRDVKSDFRVRPEFFYNVDPRKASLFDMDRRQVDTAVNYAFEGLKVGEVDFRGDKNIDLIIRNQESHRGRLRDLTDLPLVSASGQRVILEQVADVERTLSPNVIHHYDQRRAINVRCELEEGVLADTVIRRLMEAVAAERGQRRAAQPAAMGAGLAGNRVLFIDDEIIIERGGETALRDDAMSDLTMAMATAFAVILIILVVKFNSFLQAGIVLFSVPLSLVGVAIGLTVCGFSFSVSSMIGVVALAGIVVNDAIVLVDFINRLRASGVPLERAIVFAGQLRLRPIFLTTVTTIGGLMPLALNLTGGGEFWQPLSVTIMFGLGFATLLQLFILPLACYTFGRSTRKSLFDPLERPDLAAPPTTA